MLSNVYCVCYCNKSKYMQIESPADSLYAQGYVGMLKTCLQ